MNEVNKALIVKNLCKSYKNIKAVQDVSFEVLAKEVFALVGPNGAGKSTTLKIVAGILNKDSGQVEVFGSKVSENSIEARQKISYLPEEAGAYKNLSGLDYLKFMAALQSDKSEEQKNFVEFGREISGLGERLKQKVKTYSKGMTRKLLLARTVMNRPKLAILDEPTSGLDVVNAFEIRKIIKNLAQEGMAVLLSSHNMLEIEFLSERVAIIDKGKITTMGEPHELKEKYSANNLEEVFLKTTKKNNLD